MAYFFEMMNIVKTNKIQYFIILSLTFHAILFIAWANLIPLKKDLDYIDVFLVRDNFTYRETPSNTKEIYRSNKKNTEIKNLKKNNIEAIPDENIENISIKTEDAHVKTTEISKGIDIYTKSNSSQNTGEKIIDTAFGTINGPKFIYREIPVYPQVARRLGKEGKVVLRLTINEKGELINIEIIESAPYGFTESAIEAVKKSKFLPAMKDGSPISSRAILPIKFVLKN